MYDYGLSTLEQYGLTAETSARTRGALLCRTERGLVIIREYKGFGKKLLRQQLLQDKLEQEGLKTDSYIQNLEGELITRDRDGIAYTLQRWYEGRECDTRERGDILKSTKTLAKYHWHMVLPQKEIKAVDTEEQGEESPDDKNFYTEPSLAEEYARHNQELRKIRRFIRKKGASAVFEKEYLASAEDFIKKGEEALALLQKSPCETLRQNALEKGSVCHGDYTQHNVLMQKNGTVVINFDRWYYGVQMGDLYHFMRKILEKYRWDTGLGRAMLKEYAVEKSISREEWQYLKIRFTYPDKYWKIANYYYTHNKAWISAKNVEKLKKAVTQKEAWDRFVCECFEKYPF